MFFEYAEKFYCFVNNNLHIIASEVNKHTCFVRTQNRYQVCSDRSFTSKIPSVIVPFKHNSTASWKNMSRESDLR